MNALTNSLSTEPRRQQQYSPAQGGPTTVGAWRYERKFVLQGYSVPEVLALIRRHPAAFGEAYPCRIINNVYLDTDSLHDYFNHVSGAAERFKTRIRWYGPVHGTIPSPTLEQKIKRGLVNAKHSYPLPPLHLNGSIDRCQLTRAFDHAELPDLVRSRLHHLRPVLVNRYHRHYLLTADHRFRLTVDAALEFHPVNCSWSNARHADDTVIIELKFAPLHAQAAAVVVGRFPFRVNRCSKYVLGVERLHVH